MADTTCEPNTSTIDDADLIQAVRNGSTSAYADLWRRHYPQAYRFAQASTRRVDPDDIVSESFTRIFASIKAGKGPTGSFRSYLLSTVRNSAIELGRRAEREMAYDALDYITDNTSVEDVMVDEFERMRVATVAKSLPERWRTILQYTAVEQRPTAEIGALMNLNSNAIAALSFRARRAFREKWLQLAEESGLDQTTSLIPQ
jgi:RNA polymerase sigma factor (sigma-70 family)